MERMLGIDGQFIPRDEIPFDFRYLKDFDRLVGDDGEELLYSKPDRAYRLVTTDPVHTFLSTPHQNWRKI